MVPIIPATKVYLAIMYLRRGKFTEFILGTVVNASYKNFENVGHWGYVGCWNTWFPLLFSDDLDSEPMA